jgi:hypothetical protein
MKTNRTIYDTAFKVKAVELSNERSNITKLARELGIHKKNRLIYESIFNFKGCILEYCRFYNLLSCKVYFDLVGMI